MLRAILSRRIYWRSDILNTCKVLCILKLLLRRTKISSRYDIGSWESYFCFSWWNDDLRFQKTLPKEIFAVIQKSPDIRKRNIIGLLNKIIFELHCQVTFIFCLFCIKKFGHLWTKWDISYIYIYFFIIIQFNWNTHLIF